MSGVRASLIELAKDGVTGTTLVEFRVVSTAVVQEETVTKSRTHMNKRFHIKSYLKPPRFPAS